MKKLFEHKKADIFLNEDTNAIELIWKEVNDTESYRLLFTKVLEFLKQHKATCFLSDIRKEGVVGPANSKWVQEEVLPKASANGLQRIAVVMDADVFKSFYVNKISHAAGSDRMKYFQSTGDANAWLKG